MDYAHGLRDFSSNMGNEAVWTIMEQHRYRMDWIKGTELSLVDAMEGNIRSKLVLLGRRMRQPLVV